MQTALETLTLDPSDPDFRPDYRVTLHYCEGAGQPEGIAYGDVFTLDPSPRGFSERLNCGPQTTLTVGERDLCAAFERLGDWDLVLRWLRQAYDVVATELRHMQDGSVLLEAVTRATADAWGVPAENVAKCTSLSDWADWADGEVFGYVVEKLVTWTTEDEDFEDEERWEETDESLWEIFGFEYAKEAALDALRWLSSNKTAAQTA